MRPLPWGALLCQPKQVGQPLAFLVLLVLQIIGMGLSIPKRCRYFSRTIMLALPSACLLQRLPACLCITCGGSKGDL